jgi:hypothetical protein
MGSSIPSSVVGIPFTLFMLPAFLIQTMLHPSSSISSAVLLTTIIQRETTSGGGLWSLDTWTWTDRCRITDCVCRNNIFKCACLDNRNRKEQRKEGRKEGRIAHCLTLHGLSLSLFECLESCTHHMHARTPRRANGRNVFWSLTSTAAASFAKSSSSSAVATCLPQAAACLLHTYCLDAAAHFSSGHVLGATG